jgi:hypothetical protein
VHSTGIETTPLMGLLPSAIEVGSESSTSKLIIFRALIGIIEDGIGLRDFLKLGLGFFIIRV